MTRDRMLALLKKIDANPEACPICGCDDATMRHEKGCDLNEAIGWLESGPEDAELAWFILGPVFCGTVDL